MPNAPGLERRVSDMGRIDALFFALSAFSACWLAYLLLRDGARPGWQSLLLVVFWVFVSYLLLPRLHRILTRLYVPGYFIGRARTSDGLLGDPVNVALLGRESQVHQAMCTAGWVRAHDLDLRAGWRIVTSTLRRRSYPEAPVSPLHLFDRQQDFSYQQEVAGSPSRRHHVRFWRCPDDWMLPGGHAVDWLAAGTYDRSVGLSLFTLQVTHKIEENTDHERDFIVQTVTGGDCAVDVEVIRNFSTGYHSRNGGGDRIQTDGHLPVLDLRRVDAPAQADQSVTDSRDRRHAPTVFGAGVALVRALIYLVAAVAWVVSEDFFYELAAEGGLLVAGAELQSLLFLSVALLLVAALADAVLAVAVLAGSNWARLTLMSLSALTTALTFATSVRAGEAVPLLHLPTIGISTLVMLALSSHRAREFATRPR